MAGRLTPKILSEMPADKLADLYVEAIEDFIDARDLELLPANKQKKFVDRLYLVQDEIHRRTDKAQEILENLLKNTNPHVKVYAAVQLIGYSRDRAMNELQSLSTVPGMAGFGARNALKLY